jgi:hypothetical protein
MYFDILLLHYFCYIIPKHTFTNTSEQDTSKWLWCFISWLVHSLLYSWQSSSLTTVPQRVQPQHLSFKVHVYYCKKIILFLTYKQLLLQNNLKVRKILKCFVNFHTERHLLFSRIRAEGPNCLIANKFRFGVSSRAVLIQRSLIMD